MRLPGAPGDPESTFGQFDAGHIRVMLDRGDYWQCAYVIPKGRFDELKRPRGSEAFCEEIAADRADSAGPRRRAADWDDVELLAVGSTVAALAPAGLLCIGDAAHAMSPIGGVGINSPSRTRSRRPTSCYEPLRAGTPSDADLARVQRRRTFPVRVTQAAQVFVQDSVIRRALGAPNRTTKPLPFQLFQIFPFLRRLPARIVGVGFAPSTSTRPKRRRLRRLRHDARTDRRVALPVAAVHRRGGPVDAVSFLALGHVFVVNMTGNLVFLGFAAAGVTEVSLTSTLVAVVAFIAGSAAGGRIGRRFAGARLAERRGRGQGGVGGRGAWAWSSWRTASLEGGAARDGDRVARARDGGPERGSAQGRHPRPDHDGVHDDAHRAGLGVDARRRKQPALELAPARISAMLVGAFAGGLCVLHAGIAVALGLVIALLAVTGVLARFAFELAPRARIRARLADARHARDPEIVGQRVEVVDHRRDQRNAVTPEGDLVLVLGLARDVHAVLTRRAARCP